MGLTTRNVVLLALAAFGGRVPGKTLLQKRIYFVAEILGIDLGYDAHYYGPYSDEVASAVVQLRSSGLLREEQTHYGAKRSGFEIKRYDYELTDSGRQAIEMLKQHYPAEVERIENAASRVDKVASDLDYMELSIAAKAHWKIGRAHV